MLVLGPVNILYLKMLNEPVLPEMGSQNLELLKYMSDPIQNEYGTVCRGYGVGLLCLIVWAGYGSRFII